jgi:Dolichyl-phosphate-mannose-protein mannosyltransferase
LRSWWERFEPLRDRAAEAWALWSILAAQATLTLPWMWRTLAYSEEARYLNAGRLEWSHWLHHAHLPTTPYSTYFPGSPVIYPPVAAMFDNFGRLFAGASGGLAAARVLSLLFMLGATALVYLMGDRLFGRMSGVLAALLFAVCGIIVHLGAAATFDPMALFLLVLALHAAVRMRDGGIGWLLLCPVALAAANATKYATTAWDPLILGTIILYGWSKGRTQSLALAISVAATIAIIDCATLMLGGANMATGILTNLVSRSPQLGLPSSSISVLGHAALMTGLIVLIALGGIWVSVERRMPVTATAFLCLLVLAALLVPIDQARLHQITSLDENMGFGLPFAALAAGYALGAWRQWLGRQRHWGQIVATTAAVVTVITMLIVGRAERVQFRGPGLKVASAWKVVKKSYEPHTLVLDDSPSTTAEYYLPSIPAHDWKIVYDRLTSQAQGQIRNGCFSVVMLDATGMEGRRSLMTALTNGFYQPVREVGPPNRRIWIWDRAAIPTTDNKPQPQSAQAHASASASPDNSDPCA